MATVVVTGATGFVGSHVVPELISGGHRVLALVRSGDAGRTVLDRLPASARDGVDLRTGDVNAPRDLAQAFAGADAIVHLVALARDLDGGRSLNRVNVEGTGNVIGAARSAGIQRLVHLGALGVADDPQLHYASSKARAEALVAASGLDWTILKPSLMWGERDGFFNIVAGLVRISLGIMPVPGDGQSRFQPISVADVAVAVRLSVERPATIGQRFELGGPRYWTYREITQEVLRGMGKRRKVIPMPVALISLVAGTAELLHVPFPVATDQLRQLKLDNIGRLDSYEAAVGIAPADMAGNLGYLARKLAGQEPGRS